MRSGLFGDMVHTSFESMSNQRFVAAMQKTYSEVTGTYAAGMYVGGQVIEAVLEKMGGSANSKDGAFRDANAHRNAGRHAARTDAIRPLRPSRRSGVHSQVRAQGRQARQHRDQDLTDVSQFWTYDEAGILGATRLFARPPARQELQPRHHWGPPFSAKARRRFVKRGANKMLGKLSKKLQG